MRLSERCALNIPREQLSRQIPMDDAKNTDRAANIRTALIFDDDEEMREMLKELLRREGYVGIDILHSQIPHQVLIEEHVDIIVVDIVSLKAEWIELITRFRSRRPTIRMIAISGRGKNSPDYYARKAREIGADHIVWKPFQRRELVEIARSLRKHASDSNGSLAR